MVIAGNIAICNKDVYVVYNIAIHDDGTTLYSGCEEDPDLWQQLKLALK